MFPKRLTSGDVMRFGLLAAGLVWLSMTGTVGAQSPEVRAPVELPPPSYTGRQYVDSAGCVFVRAGYGSVVNWVPRVGRDRNQICGYTPTLGARAAPTVATAPARPSEPLAQRYPAPAAGGPMRTIALSNEPPRIGLAARKAKAAPSAPPRAVPRKAAPKPVPVAPVRIVSVRFEDGRGTNCPNMPPVAQRFVLSDGRQFLRCGPAVADPVAALNRARVPGLRVVGPVPPSPPRAVRTAQAVPKGYEPAFRDGRLNPNRGPRTAAGNAQMARVWTDDVPARMHKTAPAPAHVGGGAVGQGLVQVGAFAVPSNAENTRQTLRRLNLPVAVSRARQRSGAIEVIYAGPFATAEAQAAALSAVRRAGYRDAFMR